MERRVGIVVFSLPRGQDGSRGIKSWIFDAVAEYFRSFPGSLSASASPLQTSWL